MMLARMSIKNIVGGQSRWIHLSTKNMEKVENTKIVYELPEVLKRMEDNASHRLKAELAELKGDIKGLQGEIKGFQGEIKGEVRGLGHKVAVYAGLAGAAVGFTLKLLFDYASTRKKT